LKSWNCSSSPFLNRTVLPELFFNVPKKKKFLGISGAESEQGYIVLTDVITIEELKNMKIKSIRTMILPVVSCGYESLSLTLRREPRLRMF
jgi:hypothetical protein